MLKASYVVLLSRKRWLEESLGSILNQTMSDVEIIIGDSNQSFNGNKDSRIREINTDGMHVNDALNLLISEAKTDIILIHNDDDLDLPNRVQVCYDGIQDCDIFCASYRRMDIDGNVYADEIILPWDYDGFIYRCLNMPLFSGAFRKSTCPKWDNKFFYLSDVKFIIESYLKGLKIKTSPEIVAQMRYWDGQISHSCSEKDYFRNEEKKDIDKIFGINLVRL
jgi:glycosyltransferase involved in cell wall biosynthesis